MNRAILDGIVHYYLCIVETACLHIYCCSHTACAHIVHGTCLLGAETNIGIAHLRVLAVFFEYYHSDSINRAVVHPFQLVAHIYIFCNKVLVVDVLQYIQNLLFGGILIVQLVLAVLIGKLIEAVTMGTFVRL